MDPYGYIPHIIPALFCTSALCIQLVFMIQDGGWNSVDHLFVFGPEKNEGKRKKNVQVTAVC